MADGNDDGGTPGAANSNAGMGGRWVSKRRGRSTIKPVRPVDHDLLDALKKVGEKILSEPTPKRLLDAVRRNKR